MLIDEALSEMEGVKSNGQNIKTIRYAADTAVVASSELELQRMMNGMVGKCEEFGMSLNSKKTMVMKIAKDPSPLNIRVSGEILQQLSEYNYLESGISEDIRSLGDIKKRIGMGKTAFWKCRVIKTGHKSKSEEKDARLLH